MRYRRRGRYRVALTYIHSAIRLGWVVPSVTGGVANDWQRTEGTQS